MCVCVCMCVCMYVCVCVCVFVHWLVWSYRQTAKKRCIHLQCRHRQKHTHTRVHKWRMYCADCVGLNVDAVEDVHCAAGLLKLYFRELAEPPFTDEKYAEFIAIGSESCFA